MVVVQVKNYFIEVSNERFGSLTVRFVTQHIRELQPTLLKKELATQQQHDVDVTTSSELLCCTDKFKKLYCGDIEWS